MKKMYHKNEVIFPFNVEAPEQMLCSTMWILNFPLHERSVRTILKPFVCDNQVPRLLERMVDGKYLVEKSTSLGTFYGLTAKSQGYLDYKKEHYPHRTMEIIDSSLCTNLMKGELCASAIVSAAAKVYVAAWNALPKSNRDAYMRDNSIAPEAFQHCVNAADTATIDVLPRSVVKQDALITAVAEAFESGDIPFTDEHRMMILREAKLSLLGAMMSYDDLIRQKMRLIAQRNSLGSKNTKMKAKQFPKLTKRLEKIESFLESCEKRCTISLINGQTKVVSNDLLARNGVGMSVLPPDDDLVIHVFDDCINGLTRDTLVRRMEIALSLTRALNYAPHITVYTLAENRGVVRDNVIWMMRNRKVPLDLKINIKSVFYENPVSQDETLASIKKTKEVVL